MTARPTSLLTRSLVRWLSPRASAEGPATRAASPADGSRVSVVLAAYEEAGAIADVIRGVRATLPDLHELLVVDDGSKDGTADVARAAGAKVVQHRANRGKGCAIRTGIAAATGDVLVFLDSDGQDDPGEIPLLLGALGPGVAMVIGSRFRGRLLDGAITPLNHVGNLALTAIFNRLHEAELTDTQAGFRAVRRAALDPGELAAREYEIETELTMHVLGRGGRVVEVPVSRSARAAGETGFIRPYHGLRILGWMVAGRVGRDLRRVARR